MSNSPDVVIVGGGLSGSLLAWSLKHVRPEIRVQVLESRAADDLPSKTWCFHETDLQESCTWLQPLIARTWSSHSVHFPSWTRSMGSRYCALKPERLFPQVQALLQGDFISNVQIQRLDTQTVEARDGRKWQAPCVIDARSQWQKRAPEAYQKFVGFQVRLEKPHGLLAPILMDARVAQLDGYRFFYILPWNEKELLIEDTRYSSSADIDFDSFCLSIQEYCRQRNWVIEDVLDVEMSALPLPMASVPASGEARVLVPEIGMGAGFFHPVTGYSIAKAIAVCNRIARLEKLTSANVQRALEDLRAETSRDFSFFYFLNRMLFLAAEPEQRIRVFEHFYRMPETVISNFYRGHLPWHEKLRILSGKPPVPVQRALSCVLGGFQ